MTAMAVFQSETIESLRRQLGDDAGMLLGELIGLYIEQAGDLVTQLEDSATTLDHARLRTVAHKLKGSTATMGGDRLAALCRRIEVAGPAELDVPGAVCEVRREYGLLADELVRYRRSLVETAHRAEPG